jgi:hypothetical protein
MGLIVTELLLSNFPPHLRAVLARLGPHAMSAI